MTDWDERYKRGEYGSQDPHSVLIRFGLGLSPGRALDVACGIGRHAIWLAERGWQVTAVDSSPAAIDILQGRSIERGLKVDARVADLKRDEFRIKPAAYDLIVVCNYLQRDLFGPIKTGKIGRAHV